MYIHVSACIHIYICTRLCFLLWIVSHIWLGQHCYGRQRQRLWHLRRVCFCLYTLCLCIFVYISVFVSLNEFGNTFDLAHTAMGVMARGFDDLHKVYMLICNCVSLGTIYYIMCMFVCHFAYISDFLSVCLSLYVSPVHTFDLAHKTRCERSCCDRLWWPSIAVLKCQGPAAEIVGR